MEKRTIDTSIDISESIPPREMNPSRTSRRRRVLLPVITACVIACYTCYQWFAGDVLLAGGALAPTVRDLVPLEAHIISKCPDTRVWHYAPRIPHDIR